MVNFGDHLQRNRAVEWSAHYVRYDVLKSIVERLKTIRMRHALARKQAAKAKKKAARHRHATIRSTTDDESDTYLGERNYARSGDSGVEGEGGSGSGDPSHRRSHHADDEGEGESAKRSTNVSPPDARTKNESLATRVRAALTKAIGVNFASENEHDSETENADYVESDDDDGEREADEDTNGNEERDRHRDRDRSTEFKQDESEPHTVATPLRNALRQALRQAKRTYGTDFSISQRRLEKQFVAIIVADAERVDAWFTQQLAYFMRQFTVLQKQYNSLRAADAAAEQKIRGANYHPSESETLLTPTAMAYQTAQRKANAFQIERYAHSFGSGSDGNASDSTTAPTPSPELPLHFTPTNGDIVLMDISDVAASAKESSPNGTVLSVSGTPVHTGEVAPSSPNSAPLLARTHSANSHAIHAAMPPLPSAALSPNFSPQRSTLRNARTRSIHHHHHRQRSINRNSSHTNIAATAAAAAASASCHSSDETHSSSHHDDECEDERPPSPSMLHSHDEDESDHHHDSHVDDDDSHHFPTKSVIRRTLGSSSALYDHALEDEDGQTQQDTESHSPPTTTNSSKTYQQLRFAPPKSSFDADESSTTLMAPSSLSAPPVNPSALPPDHPSLLTHLTRISRTGRDGLLKGARTLVDLGTEAAHETKHLTEEAQLKLRALKTRNSWKQLRAACKELYRGLMVLKDFKSLNYTAFSKILKKHDKESVFVSFNAIAFRHLDHLSCFSSPQPLTLMVEVEELFTRGFSRGNRKAALAALRPQAPQLSHLVTFRLGLLLGLSMCLCVLFFVLIHFVQINASQTVVDQLSPVLPIYRGLFLVILHLWCWGGNVYLFHEKRINYMFIFEIDPRTELQHPQVLQIAALLTFGWFLSLDLYVSTTLLAAYWPNLQAGYFHMTLYLIILIIALCPFDYFARGTRLYVAKTLWLILTTGYGPVAFRTFYTTNQLCSLVNVFNDLSYGLCYYGTGDFLTNSAPRCKKFQSDALWVIAFIPYYFRFIQCLKRYYDSKAIRQLYNAGKYSLSLLTTFWSVMHKHYPSGEFLPHWIICAIMSTTASYTWDVKCDWGLFEFHPDVPKEEAAAGTAHKKKSFMRRYILPKNFPATDSLLRRRRVLEWAGWYYWAIFSDCVCRLAWVWTISPGVVTGGAIPVDYFKTIIYSVEVLRRNQWNFFRLENEHLGNVEKEKVVNIVPLANSPTGAERAKKAAQEKATLATLSSVNSSSTDFEPIGPKTNQTDQTDESGLRIDQAVRNKRKFACPAAVANFAERVVRIVSKPFNRPTATTKSATSTIQSNTNLQLQSQVQEP